MKPYYLAVKILTTEIISQGFSTKETKIEGCSPGFLELRLDLAVAVVDNGQEHVQQDKEGEENVVEEEYRSWIMERYRLIDWPDIQPPAGYLVLFKSWIQNLFLSIFISQFFHIYSCINKFT